MRRRRRLGFSLTCLDGCLEGCSGNPTSSRLLLAAECMAKDRAVRSHYEGLHAAELCMLRQL